MSVMFTFGVRVAGVLALSSALALTVSAQTGGQKPPAPATAKPAAPRAAAPAPAVAAPGKGTADRYVATVAPSLAGIAGETVTVDLIRWSADADRDKLVVLLKDKGDKDFAAALAAAPSLGYIWRSGSGFGSFVRYATKWKAADGEHVVLITDSDLANWGTKPGATAAPAARPYAVIELTLAAAAPAGKTSHTGKVVADTDAKTIRLEDFKTAPVALRGVKHIKGGA
ncbi:MAG: hypothetical protein ABL971_16310 [Vicinamibacterales bacterium]